jgi:AcrR family transcriptional regulator
MPNHNLGRGEKTREAILQAAHDLFAEQGYHGTSMRQIAGSAGIALGGLYNHFESKEQVFEAVFLESHPYREVIPALLEARGATIELFANDAIRRMVSTLKNHPQFLNLMFIEVVEFKSVHAGELFAHLLPDISRIVEGIIETNHERLRPIPPLMLMRFYFGLFFSYFLTDLIFSPQAPPEFNQGAVDHYVDIFLHGVLRWEPPHAQAQGDALE